MEVSILILLSLLIILVVVLILRTKKLEIEDKVKNIVTESLVNFQTNIQQTMTITKQEVEKSKDILSQGTVKTFETLKEMESTIQQLIQQQKEAQEIGQSLKYLLQTPKLRGSYGETVLEEMLDRVLPKGIWERQYSIDGRELVDAVVKYRNVIIPIDSKFPREDYERYLSSESEEDKKLQWKKYEEALKRQINSIKSKYIKPEKGTSEFALMFIPSEGIYYETIAEKNYLGEPCAIYEYAQERHVIPVSPNTFYAFLQIIIFGIRNLEIIQSAKKLQEGLSVIEKNFNNFYKKFEEIGRNLEKASDSYRVGEGHIKRFKDKLDATLRLELPEEEKKLLNGEEKKKLEF
ncbi:hypothetical protein DRQ09_01920 [candidate division KSB1 bacterium]|nr:MAG: hypothetical protein DRQ09_01920 [candidate division KSB1 bacterium]